jgi:predicted RNA-binding Zn-ribbon protein involved in translation (DUF1610 family)
MGYISLSLKMSIYCSNCRETLPINKAAERILCNNCGEETFTPLIMWKRLVTPQLTDAMDMKPETDSWANGILGGLGSYSMEFGKMLPRCEDGCGEIWKLNQVIEIAESGSVNFSCNRCGKLHTVRKIPEFFKSVIPFAKYLVAEESPEAEGKFTGSKEGIGIWCYYCGARLTLDGSSRKVHCGYCDNDLLIPDDIWQRLNPVKTAHFWYIILDIGNHVGILPVNIDSFLDLEAMPNGDTILLWREDSTGHIGRCDRTNGFVWRTKDFFVNDYTRLLYDRGRNILWTLHSMEHMVYCFDADNGKLINRFENSVESDSIISVKGHTGIAICSDGTFLVNQAWGYDRWLQIYIRDKEPERPPGYVQHHSSLHRFDSDGKRISLWEGFSEKDVELFDNIAFKDLADRPLQIPERSLLMGGPDNTIYVLDRRKGNAAVFDRSGKLVKTIKPELEGVAYIQDAGVACDGSIYVLFDHKKKIRRENYSHVGKISLEGEFKILAGPNCEKNNITLGTGLERMAVGENGEMHLADSKMHIFRILASDGSPIWKSLSTYSEDEDMRGHIARKE